jgi:hypothetical protein
MGFAAAAILRNSPIVQRFAPAPPVGAGSLYSRHLRCGTGLAIRKVGRLDDPKEGESEPTGTLPWPQAIARQILESWR